MWSMIQVVGPVFEQDLMVLYGRVSDSQGTYVVSCLLLMSNMKCLSALVDSRIRYLEMPSSDGGTSRRFQSR